MFNKNIVAIGGGGFGRSLGDLKIEKYKYQRTQVNQSNNPNVGYITSNEFNKSKQGTSVKGAKYMGGVILPMPKVEDVNGVDYGENKLGLSGLAAMGILNIAENITATEEHLRVKQKVYRT